MDRNLRATIAIIVINVIIFILSEFVLNKAIFFAYFGLNYFAFNGFYWQILTTMFLHANFWHLAMNMAVLYQFGSILERYLGSLKFSLVYLIGGILTSLLSLAYTYFMIKYSGTVVNLVGASGAISVLLGLLAYLEPRIRDGLILAILIMSFAPMLIGINIGWYAHLIGFGIGFLYGKFLKR